MKAVQSCWFNIKGNKIDYKGGWDSINFNLFSWALSIFKLNRYFQDTELITDSIGADICYKLQLPYSIINTDLDQVKDNNYFWVQNKIYTYSIQQEPFIHIDTDAYFFEPINTHLLQSPIIVQNLEYDQDVYVSAYQEVILKADYLPSIIKKDLDGRLTAVNAGIIGGTNVKLFKEFAQFIDTFLQKNINELSKCNYYNLNPFIEQFLFKKFIDKNNVDIQYYSTIERGPEDDYQLANFSKLPGDCPYIHLMNYKNNPTVCEQMSQRLWLEAPDLYYRVLDVSRQLNSTHHYYNFSKDKLHDNQFYRTKYLQSFISSNTTKSYIDTFIVYSESIINEQEKVVFLDCLQYENSIYEYINYLPPYEIILESWKANSIKVNTILALKYAQYRQMKVCESKFSKRISSEWNWSETNEFFGQGQLHDYATNLKDNPSYFEVILYIYIHLGVIREHLLDILSIIILDHTDQHISIEDVIGKVTNQIIENQPTFDAQELFENILNRIRYFLYNGILEFIIV